MSQGQHIKYNSLGEANNSLGCIKYQNAEYSRLINLATMWPGQKPLQPWK